MSKRKRSRAAAGDLILKSVTVLGVKVDVKRRRGTPNLQLEAFLTRDGEEERVRRSARTTDLDRATEAANCLALELAKLLGVKIPLVAEWLIARGVGLTLGEVFHAYRETKFPTIAQSAVIQAECVMKHFCFLWGADLRVVDISQTLVDAFVTARRGGITGPGLSPKSAYGVRLNTAREEVKKLGTILNAVGCLKHEGRRVFAGNPLEGIRVSEDVNIRRPAANARRYALYLRFEPELIPWLRNRDSKTLPPTFEGMYRLLLVLARETGHRIGAIQQLRFSDILLSEEKVRSALALTGGFHEEGWAESWPAGAIHWRSENDKKKFGRVTPISRRVAAELEWYIAQRGDVDPEAYLFPHPRDHKRCINKRMLWMWMNVLEEIIRERGYPLTKFAHGQYHPFRRMWMSERSGAFDPRLIALVGGWTVKTGVAMLDSYQWFTPTAAFLCVEFDPAVHRTLANLIPGVMVPKLAEEVLSPEHLQRELSALRGDIEPEELDRDLAAD